MQHLTLEDLARLVDEPPVPAEAAHLRDCLACRRELAEMRAQTEALASLAGPGPSEEAWTALEARLVEEKLVRTGIRTVPWYHRPPLRVAAALVLFLAGGAAGAALWNGRGAERVAQADPAADAPAPSRTARPAGEPDVIYVGAPEAEPAAPEAGTAGATFAMNGGEPEPTAPQVAAPRAAPERATRREAQQAALELVQAQAAYVAALQRLAGIAHPASGNDPETRLAALDQLVELTAEALERVPGDAVINGYHLAAVAERDALRRQIVKDAETEWF